MIFLVEDDPTLRRSIASFLEAKAFEVQAFEDAESALKAAEAQMPDAAVCDVQLPGMSGIELVAELGKLDANVVRLVMTAHSSVQGAVAAVRAGAFEYLEKPLDLEKLSRLLERALSAQRKARELTWHRTHPGEADEMLGGSAVVKGLLAQLQAVAGLGTEGPPVLILGETGVGKGLLARIVHRVRVGAQRPWLEVNCAALPEALVESELFGHERNAFTNAGAAKPGLFEAAEGGTLFLDEIGELPLEAQAKLLKVLESRRVRRVGSVRERPVQVAIVAASNVDLEQAVADGAFRKDLYHRLAALPITVPPLRTRGDDAVVLARAFTAELAHRYRRAPKALPPEAEDAIRSNPWPGNVRELRFAIERAVLMTPAEATELDPALLPAPPRLVVDGAPAATVEVGTGGVTVALPPGGMPFEDIERAVLQEALRRTQGNVVQAARFIGLSRDALRYRLRRLGIEPAPAG